MITAAALRGAAITMGTFVANRFVKMVGGGKADSLASFTRSTRVEPIALVDDTLIHRPYLQDVLQVANSTFTGYYLQGLALYNTSVNGVRVMDVLNALNPSRDVKDAMATTIVDSTARPGLLSMEAYKYRLPLPDQALGLEAFGCEAAVQDRFNKIPSSLSDVEEMNARDSAAFNRPLAGGGDPKKLPTKVEDAKHLTNLKEAVDLSVGRMFEVELQQGGQILKVPVLVRTIVTVIQSSMLAHILGGGARNNSLKERFWAWRAGQLEFIRDIVLMQDMIDAHKRNLLKDETGVYTEIMRRRRDNNVSSFVAGNPSIGTASNIVVMSKRTADTVERTESGRFRDPAFRQRIFKNTYMLLLFVVDDEMERVTIYHRDIALPTELSVKEMRASAKSGADPMEILKAYTLGQPARY